MNILIRPTEEDDWRTLKEVRLAALLDTPDAFGLSHASAAAYSEAQWRERAAQRTAGQYLLAFVDGAAAGMAGHFISDSAEFNLIAMWVRPQYRGREIAAGLVDTVKARAVSGGHGRVVLDVSPDNGRAACFYLKQGFAFLPEWEQLASNPAITLQKMAWLAD